MFFANSAATLSGSIRTRNKLLSVLHGVLSRQPMVMVAAERPDARFARMVNSNLGRAELRPG